MDHTDIHFFPPSSSVLVALSSLTPPSPILSAAEVFCSNDHIPILLDFEITPSVSCSTTASISLAGQPGVIYSGSVGTFGPQHRQSQNGTTCWSPISPAFPGHSDPSWPILDDLGPTISRRRGSPSPSTALNSSQTTTIQSSSCTPASLSPSPSATPSVNSCSSSPRLRRKFKFPIECNDPTSLPASKSWIQVSDSQEHKVAPSDFTRTLTVPGFQMTQDVRPPLVRQPPIQCPSPQDCETQLLDNLSWLKDTVVELLVDQESFRAIHPTFKLVGLPKQARGWDASDGGLALFHPVKRETFQFHYAPLDGLPILRRLIVNGDETRDFISRQGTLSLKTNGVYTVHGSESSHLSSSCFELADFKPGPDNTKFKWQFDYLVNDRLEQSGRVVDGEKTMTPLSFLCSPWLLHPNQAKKMKLMHIVKKSVTTKLVAEKLEPPTLPSHIPQPPPGKPAVAHRLWTLHRRVQSSHAESEQKPKKKTGSLRRTGEKSEKTRRDENQENLFVGRRRRASSAGEGRRPVSPTLHPAINPLAKHIIPRAQLAELLNNQPQQVGISQRLPCEFHGLSPAPRRGDSEFDTDARDIDNDCLFN